jgi:hypothetical protein
MKKLGLLFFALLCCSPAFAWNCSTSGQVRVQVPAGTIGSGTGDGPGQVVVDNGLTFECETLPTTAPNAGNTNTNTNNNTSTATGGNATAAGGNASSTATGGNSTSNQTQGQKQGQSQSSNNQSAGGSVSNVGNSVENIEAPKIPVASAYAPTTIPSAPCVKGFGAGIQTMPIGGSLGGSKVDAGCDIREDARSFFLAGSRLAGCKMLVSSKRSQKAGVTLQDCLTTPPIVVAPVPVVQPVVPPAPQVTVVQAPPTFVYLSAPPVASAPVIPVKPTPVKHAARRKPVDPCYATIQECVVIGHRQTTDNKGEK